MPATAPPIAGPAPAAGPARPHPAERAASDAAVEAARYAVLRRIGPALRHDLVVNLQAVAMMAEVLGTRLDRVAPEGVPADPQLQSNLTRLHRLAREAVGNSLQVADWLSPSDDDTIDLRQGLEDALALVRSSFGFRGFQLQLENDVPAGFEVPRDRLRHLLLAALIHLADESAAPGTLRVRGGRRDEEAWVSLDMEADAPADALAGAPSADDAAPDLGYRPLAWADVVALAGEAAPQRGVSPDRIVLRLPRARALSPLKVAPR